MQRKGSLPVVSRGLLGTAGELSACAWWGDETNKDRKSEEAARAVGREGPLIRIAGKGSRARVLKKLI
jgi:hypothetical protein